MKPQPLPKGLLGAIFGAIGALPLLPLASGWATRHSAPSTLPSLERSLHQVKAATYAEAVVLLFVLPFCAFAFGSLIPRFLERRARTGALSFEWIGAGFASSWSSVQHGIRPKHALLVGLLLAALMAKAIREFRSSPRVRRFFARSGRKAAAKLAFCGAGLALAWRGGAGIGIGVAIGPSGARAPALDVALEVAIGALLLPIGVALVSLALSDRPDAVFRRAGDSAWIPLLIAAAALAFPRAALPLAAIALIAFLALVTSGVAEGRSLGGERVAWLAFLLLCGWRANPDFASLDLFEDGHSLFPAQAYLHGARPYRDVVPVHGWGADGGVDAVSLRTFGATLSTYQWRKALWSAAAFGLLALASCVALGSIFWGGLALLLALDVGQFTIERQMLAFAALWFLFRAARTKRSVRIVAAGSLAALALLHSFEYGLIVLIGGLAGLLLLPCFERGFRRAEMVPGWRDSGWFLGGFVLGATPFAIVLAAHGTLSDFLRASFVTTPKWVAEVWNFPAGSAWQTLHAARSLDAFLRILAGEGMPALFALLLLAAAAGNLLLRSAAGRFDATDRAVLLSVAIAMVAMRAVLGRADREHLWHYGVFVGVPASWLLMRAWQEASRGRPLMLAAAALILVRLHPVAALERALNSIVDSPRRNAETPEERAPRAGAARLSRDEASALNQLHRYLDAHLGAEGTFFDFDNQPGLYFLMDRNPPVPFATVPQYESPVLQRQVIELLEEKKPAVAILAAGFYSQLDGVSNEDRAPEVAKYLASHYEGNESVASWRLAQRKPAGVSP